MKYICTETPNGTEEIFVFPKTIDHDRMAEVLMHIREGDNHNWERVMRQSVSAGFIDTSMGCVGESITLKLKSRPQDTAILSRQMG